MNLDSDQWVFLNEFLRHPLQVAAIQPTSNQFVEDLLSDIPFEEDALYVEYGAGTGVVSGEICKRMSRDSVCVAVEPNEAFSDFLSRGCGRLKVIQERAENATNKILELYGSADFIVAGLPYSLMPEDSISKIISEARVLLGSGGELRLFFYAHSLLLPKIQRMIDGTFDGFHLTWTRISWSNIPPMAIVRCMT